MKTRTQTFAVTTLLLFAPLMAHAQEQASPTSADLDGDGKPESISLQWKEGERQYVLKIGNATLRGQGDDSEAPELSIVDLDSGDKWKEVVVQTGLTDDDAMRTLYGFDGKAVKELGRVHALTEARGNGIILSDTWEGFWNRREKYVLDRKAWKLNLVPQELYYVGAEATVKQSFPLARSRMSKDVVANVAAQSKIQVLAAAPARPGSEELWYLVKSSTGLLGWIPGQALADKTEGLPWAG